MTHLRTITRHHIWSHKFDVKEYKLQPGKIIKMESRYDKLYQMDMDISKIEIWAEDVQYIIEGEILKNLMKPGMFVYKPWPSYEGTKYLKLIPLSEKNSNYMPLIPLVSGSSD